MKIVIVGGTGLIGSKSAPLLRSRGREVLQASPSKGVNAVRFDDWLGRAAAWAVAISGYCLSSVALFALEWGWADALEPIS